MEYDNTIPPAVAAAGRSCGDCAMCCKLPEIAEMDKKAGDWCRMCSTRQSCDDWDKRPQQCRSFFCHWMENPGLGEEWRPSKARFMIMGKDGGRTMLVVVDPDRPDAWKKQPYLNHFMQWSEKFKLVINVGEKQMILHGNHVHTLDAQGNVTGGCH